MNARMDPRMVAAKIHGAEPGGHGEFAVEESRTLDRTVVAMVSTRVRTRLGKSLSLRARDSLTQTSDRLVDIEAVTHSSRRTPCSISVSSADSIPDRHDCPPAICAILTCAPLIFWIWLESSDERNFFVRSGCVNLNDPPCYFSIVIAQLADIGAAD